MRSIWTDSRLDVLNGRVNELSARIDGLQHTMMQGFFAIAATLVTGFLGLAGLIATQL